MWQILLDFYGYVIFFYSITLIISYVILMLLAQPGIFNQHNEIEEDYAKHVVWNNPYTPGVSIVAPAFNEEMTIIDNVESLLRQRSEEHTSELQSRQYLVCRLLLEKKIIP